MISFDSNANNEVSDLGTTGSRCAQTYSCFKIWSMQHYSQDNISVSMKSWWTGWNALSEYRHWSKNVIQLLLAVALLLMSWVHLRLRTRLNCCNGGQENAGMQEYIWLNIWNFIITITNICLIFIITQSFRRFTTQEVDLEADPK